MRSRALAADVEAVEIFRQLALRSPEAHELDLARALSGLAGRLSRKDRIVEALEADRESVEILRRLVITLPGPHELDLARALCGQARRSRRLNDLDGALATATEAVNVLRRLAGAIADAHGPSLALALSILGRVYADTRATDEAIACNREALSIYRRFAILRPDSYGVHIVSVLDSLSMLTAASGDVARAVEFSDEALRMVRDFARPQLHRRRLAGLLERHGDLLFRSKLEGDGTTVLIEAIELLESIPTNSEWRLLSLGRCCYRYAGELIRVGSLSEAVVWVTKAVDINRGLTGLAGGGHNLALASSLTMLGRTLLAARVGRRRREGPGRGDQTSPGDSARIARSGVGHVCRVAYGSRGRARGARTARDGAQAECRGRRFSSTRPGPRLGDEARTSRGVFGDIGVQAGGSWPCVGRNSLQGGGGGPSPSRMAQVDPRSLPAFAVSLKHLAQRLDVATRSSESIAVNREWISICRRLVNNQGTRRSKELRMPSWP